jgi:hypothetical protein
MDRIDKARKMMGTCTVVGASGTSSAHREEGMHAPGSTMRGGPGQENEGEQKGTRTVTMLCMEILGKRMDKRHVERCMQKPVVAPGTGSACEGACELQ